MVVSSINKYAYCWSNNSFNSNKTIIGIFYLKNLHYNK